ncbi:MAG TPA: DMT family transporter [Stellaceae bacterium]|nr:DMT family transporter [Stellaceae bacterium]
MAALQLGIAIAALSCTPILFRISELGPSATSFYRTLLGVPVFMAWLAVERRRAAGTGLRLSASWRRESLELILASLFFAANILAYAWALHFTSVANASVLSNLAPIFVSLLGFLLFGERPRGGFIAAMLAAIAGVALLSYGKGGAGGGSLLGDALAAGSAVLFGGYLIIIARLRQRLAAPAIMIWIGTLSAIGLFACALAAGDALLATTLRGWTVLLGLAVVSYALGQGLLAAALAHLGAAFSSIGLLSLPAISALLGWVLLGEPLGVMQAIGGVIVLGGIFLARRASR